MFIYFKILHYYTVYLSISAKGRGVRSGCWAHKTGSQKSLSAHWAHTQGPSSHVSSPVCQITQHVNPLRAWKTFSLDTSLSGFKCASLPDNTFDLSWGLFSFSYIGSEGFLWTEMVQCSAGQHRVYAACGSCSPVC